MNSDEEIDVFVAVGVPQMRAVAFHHRQRERLGVDRRARVAAGQRGAGVLVQREALRVARAVLLLRLGERGGEVDIRGTSSGRDRLSSGGASPVLARSGRRRAVQGRKFPGPGKFSLVFARSGKQAVDLTRNLLARAAGNLSGGRSGRHQGNRREIGGSEARGQAGRLDCS